MRSPSHRLLAALAVLGVSLLAAVSSASAASRPMSVQEQRLFKYAACMRSKGVQIPDPVKGADGTYAFPKIPASVTGAAGVKAKAQACAATAGFGARGNGGGFQRRQLTPAQQAQEEKFRACLKKNGVTLPQFGSGQRRPPAGATPPAGGQRPQGGFGFRSNPKFQKAFAACRSLSPFGQGGGGFGGPPPAGNTN